MRSIAVLLLAALALAAAMAAPPTVAKAQAWPDKPIRFIVPSPPGGGTDFADAASGEQARRDAEMARWWSTTGRAPAAISGSHIAAKAAPDGYTLVMGKSSNLAINPYLHKKLPFDPAKDVAPVALLGTVPLVLVVSANASFNSLRRWSRPRRRSSSPSPPRATARWAIWSARCGSAPWPPTWCTCPTRAPAR